MSLVRPRSSTESKASGSEAKRRGEREETNDQRGSPRKGREGERLNELSAFIRLKVSNMIVFDGENLDAQRRVVSSLTLERQRLEQGRERQRRKGRDSSSERRAIDSQLASSSSSPSSSLIC